MNKTESIKLETPIGNIESDSGNHLIDIGSVILLVLVLAAIKKYVWNK